jgi:hypothetical protein
MTKRESQDLDNHITGHGGEDQLRDERMTWTGEDIEVRAELQYVETGDGPWRLYVYDRHGNYAKAPWFRRGSMQYPAEEITLRIAEALANRAIKLRLEVRVTDGGDNLVFHSIDGVVVYGADFWAEAER